MKTEELIRYYKANIEAIEKGLNNDSLLPRWKYKQLCPRCRNIVPFNIEQWIGTCIFKIIQINFTSNVTSIPEPSFIYSNQFSQVEIIRLILSNLIILEEIAKFKIKIC